MGILGGFFALQALAGISVLAPANGEFVHGVTDITWNTAVCSDTVAGIDVKYSAGGSPIMLATYVPCTDGKYTWDTTVLPDGNNYQVLLYNANNYSINGVSGVFTIDNTAPSVAAATIATPAATIAGTVAQTISWNAAGITDSHLGANPISLYYSNNGGEWQLIADNLANGGSYASWTPGFDSASVKLKIEAADLAGNKAEQESGSFAIDKILPIGAISFDKNFINDADRTRVVTVKYNEPMDKASLPQIRFTSDLNWTAGTGSWSDDETWVQSFTFNDLGQEFHASVAVTSGKDAAGNMQGEGVATSALAIDTKNPTVVSASANPDPAQAGAVAVTVVFSEEMAGVEPEVTITGLHGDYTVSGAFAADHKTWDGSFTLEDDEEEETATISVAGGEDKNGNIGGTDETHTFKVDTVTPTVSSFSFDTLTIHDGDLTQKVTVTFSEKMLETAEPQFVFSNAGYSSKNDGDWNAEGAIWTETFTFTDDGEEASGITATVSGAADVAGNAIASTISSGAFAIDTKNPTVVLTDDQTDNIVRDADTVNITATFSEAVAAPTIRFGTGTAVAMTETGDASVWTFAWNVPNTASDTADVIIAAKDAAGNDNALPTAGTPGHLSFTVDNEAPTVAVNNLITKDTTPTITGTVSDPAATVKVLVHDITYTAVKDAEGNGWTAIVTETLADGTYDVAATARDVAGNTGADGTNNELTIDTVNPQITNFVTPELGKVYGSNVTLTLTAADATALAYEYKVDADGTKIPVTFSADRGEAITASVNVPEGRHIVVLYVKDAAGNEANTSSQSFVVDTNHELTVGVTGADFTTIQAAINAATAGDKISVAAGTYAENIIIPAEKSGLVISGHSKADTFIEAASGNALTVNAAATIKGFTIDSKGTGLYGFYAIGINGVTVQDNIIKNYHRNGIYAEGGTLTITGNEMIGNGAQTDFSADSIYTKGGVTATITGNSLSGNIFENIAGGSSAGISIHAGDNVTATGNSIFGNSIGIHAKSGSIVTANENKIYGNVYNFYFEDDAALTENFDLKNNWWGTKFKSQVMAKMFGYAEFSPWFLDEAMTTLSSTDHTAPSVTVTTDDDDGIVNVGDSVKIYATVTDENGIDGAPLLTVGELVNVPMTLVSGSNWKYESWTVPAGSGSATISIAAFDAVENEGAGTKTLTVDNSAPTFTIDDGTAAGPLKTDVIKITVSDASGLAESKYGFSIDGVCDASDAYTTAFVSGTAFEIAGEHTDYLCAMATDAVGNTGYVLVGKLNTDNAAPAAPVIAMTDPVMSGNVASVSITGTGEANASIRYEIMDKNSVKISSTGTVSAEGTIAITGIDVTTLADGELAASVILTDAAGNKSAVGSDKATKDVLAPTITKVSSDMANGTYTVGQVIDIDLTFSEPVKGTFHVGLNAHAGANCDIVLETLADTGTCSYTVVANDNTSKLATTITGTGVSDEAGNAMTVFTPAFDKDIAIDTEAPVIAAHENVTAEATSAAGAYVPYVLPTATDNLDESIIVSCSPASAALYEINTTPVTCTATDDAGKTASSSFDVTVEDTTGPVFGAYVAPLPVEATGPNGAMVDYVLPTANDAVDGAVTPNCLPASGSAFALGTTQVTCTATDTRSNSSTMGFEVTVVDTTAPEITCAAIPTVEATSPQGAAVELNNCTATDLVDGNVPVSYDPASGSIFPIGNTTVNASATDAHGKTATTSFAVTVADTTAPSVSLTPADGDTVSISNPEIKAVFSDAATGVDASSISIVLDDQDMTLFATKSVSGVTYKASGLAEGVHTATVTVRDNADNVKSVTSTFQVILSSKNLTISSNKASLPADGTSAATITAALTSDGDPVAGATVKFAKTIGILSATSAVTDAEGIATVTLVSETAGVETVTATYGAGTDMKSASVSITFSEVIKDTTAPTVAAFAPADGAANVAANVNPTITFSELIDPITISDVTIGVARYSDAAMVASTKVISEVNGKTVVTIDPNANLTAGEHYYIFATATVKDLAGNALTGDWTANTKAEREFTIAATHVPVTEFGIQLHTGWNLISLPLVPTDGTISAVLSTVSANVNAVHYYDAKTDNWLTYIPSDPANSTLTKMVDGKGYWVNMKRNDTMTIYGTETPKAPASPSLYKIVGGEWNLIGFRSAEQKSVAEYISAMDDGDVIMAVDANGFYVPLKKDDLLHPGAGYWFYTPKASGLDIIPQ